jgi:hypothetical protein
MILSKVDLPEPDGPRRATTSPGSIFSEKQSMILLLPRQAETASMEMSDFIEASLL